MILQALDSNRRHILRFEDIFSVILMALKQTASSFWEKVARQTKVTTSCCYLYYFNVLTNLGEFMESIIWRYRLSQKKSLTVTQIYTNPIQD